MEFSRQDDSLLFVMMRMTEIVATEEVAAEVAEMAEAVEIECLISHEMARLVAVAVVEKMRPE